MKITELRLGSYFHPAYKDKGVMVTNTSKILKVRFLHEPNRVGYIDAPSSRTLPISWCAPVILNENILEKLGFENIDPDKDSSLQLWERNGFPLLWDERGKRAIFKDFPFGIEVRCLHLLQNLYLCFTNEELSLEC